MADGEGLADQGVGQDWTRHMMGSESAAERWRHVERIYLAALEQPERRTALLDELCAGDAELRREVESLLQARPTADTFLERGALHAAAGLVAKDTGREL